jgi:integrase
MKGGSMAIKKRGKTWMIDVYVPTGQKDKEGREIRERVRKTFKKKKEAEAEHDKMRTLVREKKFLDVAKEYTATLGELLSKYEENFKSQASWGKYKSYCMGDFKAHFGEDTELASIKYVDLETYRNSLRSKPTKRGKIRTDAAVNRVMACLHHVFTKAVEWEMLGQSPFDRGKSLILKENNRRIRYLTKKELARFTPEAKKIPHYYQIAMCALHTGMRKGEILNLKWGNIRNGFIYLEKTKTNERRETPINKDLRAILDEIKRAQKAISEKANVRPLEHVKKLTSDYVFTYARRHIGRIDRAHNTVCTKAEIEDFRFHDLRHTFASHLVMKGAKLKEVQELLGHKSIEMTMRYSHLSPEHKKNAVNLLNGLTDPQKTSWAQKGTKLKIVENNLQKASVSS